MGKVKRVKRKISRRVSAALFLLMSLIITALTVYLQPGSFIVTLGAFFAQPLLLVLNILPVMLPLLFLWFICGNIFYSSAVVSVLWGILSIINRMKINLRDEPFILRDIGLVREATDAVSKTKVEIDILPILILVLVVVTLIALGFTFYTKVVNNWLKRLTSAALIALLTCLLFVFFIGSPDIYSTFSMPTIDEGYNASAVCDRFGFPYYFIRSLSTDPIAKPDGYSEESAKEILAASKKEDDGECAEISVQFVMAESFSDIFEDENLFDFTAESDPMKNFHALRKEKGTISGSLVVSGFGGGTANTEFDVLTGMNTDFISNGEASAFGYIRSFTANLSGLFSSDRYRKSFLHPGDGWFYNRKNVYHYFGFDRAFFNEEFTETDKKGGDKWVSDEAFFRKFKEIYNEDNSLDKFGFFYGVTTQNHMAYGTYKYPDLDLWDIELKKPLSEHATDVFAAYRMGIADSDKMLGDMVDILSASKTPTLLVYFGDHKPYLGWGSDSYLGYDEAGYDYISQTTPEDIIEAHRVPFLIWENDAAKKLVDLEKIEETLGLPKGNMINASYLGALIAEITGRSGADAYFDLVNEVRRVLPVVKKGAYMTEDGTVTSEPNEEQKEAEQKLRFTQYYKMKDEEKK